LPKSIELVNWFFVWADYVSSDAECCCLKPVHSVIIENRQT